nr:hypothetical protein [uncultured Moellerella sp.]
MTEVTKEVCCENGATVIKIIVNNCCCKCGCGDKPQPTPVPTPSLIPPIPTATPF